MVVTLMVTTVAHLVVVVGFRGVIEQYRVGGILRIGARDIPWKGLEDRECSLVSIDRSHLDCVL